MLRPHIVLRAPVPADVAAVAARMRLADTLECAATGRYDLRGVLATGIARSVACWTAEVDGEPALIAGVAPLDTLLGGIGVPWMLGTELVTQHQRAFMRLSPEYIARMLGAFSHLLNFVHAENVAAVRWLRHMGFRLDEAAPYGPHREPFHRFELHAHELGPHHLLARKGRGLVSRDA
jgi:hypothetical protein